MTGIDRRSQLLEIAAEEFAIKGFHGTSVETIARRADISQPYVFRLFGTKKELFAAVLRSVHDRICGAFSDAAEGLTGREALYAMGEAYNRLLENRTLLLVMLHGFAACGDHDVRDTVRQCFGRLWTTLQQESGLPQPQIKRFMSIGMLLNDIAAMDLHEVDEPWARDIVKPLLPESW